MRIKLTVCVTALVLAASFAAPVQAKDLVFGRATEQSAIDPDFSQTGPNNATSSAMFERLVAFDAHLQMHPALALSWQALDPLTWEIKLRPGVRFIPRSPAPWTHAVTNVAKIDIVDKLTLRVHTPAPTPLLMEQIGLIFMLPAKLGDAVTTEDFNSGRAAIGTGPYRFRSWVPNDRVLLDANPDYWGGKPEFDHITLKFIPNSAARIASLLSGQVDIIDSVAPADQAELTRATQITLASSATNRIIYLAVDSAREVSPFVTGLDGYVRARARGPGRR